MLEVLRHPMWGRNAQIFWFQRTKTPRKEQIKVSGKKEKVGNDVTNSEKLYFNKPITVGRKIHFTIACFVFSAGFKKYSKLF